MKNKLNLTKQDAKTVHNEFYEPVRLLAEQWEIPKQKAAKQPTKAVRGRGRKPYLSTNKPIPQ